MKITCFYPIKKLEEPHLSAVREYEKRLHRYCKFRHLSAASGKQPGGSSVIIYVTSGRTNAIMHSSESFASFLEFQGISGHADVSFVLTDPSENVEPLISLSHAELSVPSMAVLLTEQIYRAFRIIHNHSYHK